MKLNMNITEIEKKAIINYLSGEFSASDAEVLNKWLSESESNKLLFDQFSDIWQAGYHHIAKNKIDIEQAWTDIQKRLHLGDSKKTKIVWKEILRYAAVFVIAAFLGTMGYHLLRPEEAITQVAKRVEFMAPLGSRSYVQLADGSKVWLNAGTTISYLTTYGANNRDIKLTGEAYFDVAKNKVLPFVVNSGDISVTALGTQFNVKAYAEEKRIETTLIEGSVRLDGNSFKLGKEVILKPNQKAIFTNLDKPTMEIVENVDPRPVVSWKEERWVIQNEKLGELAKKLERRYDVNFIFDDEVLKEYAFGGTLEDENIEQIMKAISYTAPIKYVIQDNTVYIMADGNKMKKFKSLLME